MTATLPVLHDEGFDVVHTLSTLPIACSELFTSRVAVHYSGVSWHWLWLIPAARCINGIAGTLLLTASVINGIAGLLLFSFATDEVQERYATRRFATATHALVWSGLCAVRMVYCAFTLPTSEESGVEGDTPTL